jgi:hypothetical protein
VAGDVLERNGHMVLDWRKRASMVVNLLFYSKCEVSMYFKVLVMGTKGKIGQNHFGGVRERDGISSYAHQASETTLRWE